MLIKARMHSSRKHTARLLTVCGERLEKSASLWGSLVSCGVGLSFGGGGGGQVGSVSKWTDRLL